MFGLPEFPKPKKEFVVPKGEIVVRAPAQYGKDLPWGKIPKTVETYSWGSRDPLEVIVTDGIDESERGLFVLRNEEEKFNRYISLGKDGTCYCEIILPDETRQMMKKGGWLKIRNVLNDKVGAERHQVPGENIDSQPDDDISRMTRVIESLGEEMTELLGQKVVFKATGRERILKYSGIVRERLSRQFINMRNLEKRFAQKPIPGVRVCRQYGYIRFPNQGPEREYGSEQRDDLEYIFMEQVDGESIPFEKHNIMYIGGVSDEYRRNDPASFVCKFADNPHLKNIVDFLDGEFRKEGRYYAPRYDRAEEISMEDLRSMIEEYVGLRAYRREAVLGDFYPRNLLLERKSDESEELVIIDQYPHHT